MLLQKVLAKYGVAIDNRWMVTHEGHSSGAFLYPCTLVALAKFKLTSLGLHPICILL